MNYADHVPLTLVHPVRDPIKDRVLLAVFCDPLWCRLWAGLDVDVIPPNISLTNTTRRHLEASFLSVGEGLGSFVNKLSPLRNKASLTILFPSGAQAKYWTSSGIPEEMNLLEWRRKEKLQIDCFVGCLDVSVTKTHRWCLSYREYEAVNECLQS